MDEKRPVDAGRWVQTDRKAHEAWAVMIGKHPKAAQLMHILVAHIDEKGAVIVSQKTLADMMSVSLNTIKRALKVLKEDEWLDIVRVGSERGGVNAYVVNHRIAWANHSDQPYVAFDAKVIVNSNEQDVETLSDNRPLRQLPFFGETQVPNGEGLEPPSQSLMEGLEPDLPSVVSNKDEDYQKQLFIDNRK